MSQTFIIMGREYSERVRKKSFIITTLLMPLIVIALMVAPTLIMLYAGGGTRSVVVVDDSGVVGDNLRDCDEAAFTVVPHSLETARKEYTDTFGILYIGADAVENPNNIRLYVNGNSGAGVEMAITKQIEEALEAHKLDTQYGIRDLKSKLDSVKTSVALDVRDNDPSKEESARSSSSIAAAGMGFVLGMILYMFLLVYGAMVMQSIIEEKSTRILEMMISTVRPFELMLGKIAGIACVAATQILIWGVLVVGASTMLLPSLGGAAAAAGDGEGVMQALSSFADTGYMVSIFVWMLLFAVGGYLLYSSMFAAVGASVDSAQDAQQLQSIIMVPIIVSILVLMAAVNDPSSGIAVWCSYIPFTSPVVMMARIPSGVPVWEIAVSFAILCITFTFMVWLAARIYRVGILMHGKKPSLKEMWRWLRY